MPRHALGGVLCCGLPAVGLQCPDRGAQCNECSKQDTSGAAGLGQARSSLRAGKTAEEQEEEDVLRKLQEWSVFVYPPPAFDNESSLPNAHTFTSTVDR
eukprot:scaffold3768_cov376-Prasinococcus_capsulatus_cf.AAC.15